MEIRTIGYIFALYLLEEESTVLHGSEQTPQRALLKLKLVAGLDKMGSTKMAVAA